MDPGSAGVFYVQDSEHDRGDGSAGWLNFSVAVVASDEADRSLCRRSAVFCRADHRHNCGASTLSVEPGADRHPRRYRPDGWPGRDPSRARLWAFP